MARAKQRLEQIQQFLGNGPTVKIGEAELAVQLSGLLELIPSFQPCFDIESQVNCDN